MVAPRLWTGDVTPERLQNMVAEQDERMAVISDEGGIFEVMAGLYNNGHANIDVLLQGHIKTTLNVYVRTARTAELSAREKAHELMRELAKATETEQEVETAKGRAKS